MRNFILAKGFVDNFDDGKKTLLDVDAGKVGLFYNDTVDNKSISLSKTGKESKHYMLVLGRDKADGGPVVLPVYPNNFSYVLGKYQESSTFRAYVDLPENLTRIGDYTLIVAKKGTKFNERNKWTAMVHIKDVMDSGVEEDIAKKLVKSINFNSHNSGVKARLGASSDTRVVVEAIKPGEDYELLGADELFGIEVKHVHIGFPAYGDAKYIQDLADKAAADAGYEYTYRDAYTYLYPNYPLDPLKGDPKEDKGYDIFTMRFAEPREVKTRDDVVNQIIQVAVAKNGEDHESEFEKVLKGLAGIEEASE